MYSTLLLYSLRPSSLSFPSSFAVRVGDTQYILALERSASVERVKEFAEGILK